MSVNDIDLELFSVKWWKFLKDQWSKGNKPLKRYRKLSKRAERVACMHDKERSDIAKENDIKQVEMKQYSLFGSEFLMGKCPKCGLIYYYSANGTDIEEKVDQALQKMNKTGIRDGRDEQ